MDIKWLQERKRELDLASEYWKPIIWHSIISSLTWWAAALGLVFIGTLVGLGITVYEKQGMVDPSSFFTPNFGWGFLSVLLFIFLYQLIVETAKRMNRLSIDSEKYNWNNVDIVKEPYSVLGQSGWGIKITNNKQTTLDVSVWIYQIQEPENIILKGRNCSLGHVWKVKHMLNVGSYAKIEKGKSEIFAITTKNKENPSLFYFNTHEGIIPVIEELVVDINLEGDIPNMNQFWMPTYLPVKININPDGNINIITIDGKLQN